VPTLGSGLTVPSSLDPSRDEANLAACASDSASKWRKVQAKHIQEDLFVIQGLHGRRRRYRMA
jgi:hypothetical protein